MSKLEKSAALYFEPKSIGDAKGARCGICTKFVLDEEGEPVYKCTDVSGRINPETGVCGLYVNGKNHEDDGVYGKLSKQEAGYADNGPTHCLNCEYMGKTSRTASTGFAECEKVEGAINVYGCCNLWEKSDLKLISIQPRAAAILSR